MTAKELYKEMYSAARLWLNAQEVVLDKVLPSTIPDHSTYNFMCWQCWLNEYTGNINDAVILYSLFVYPDGRMKFKRLDCHTQKEIDIYLNREEAA